MEPKKISFGFIKTKKTEKLIVEEQKQYIECVEEKSIKILGGEECFEKSPLVIPMKPNTLITAERLKQIADEVESSLIEPNEIEKNSNIKENATIHENETLEQMAVRELLEESKNKKPTKETSVLTVPVPKQNVLEGQKESTLEDYEAVPVTDFGMAMLRGMGWTPSNNTTYKQPQLRPKGLGLGADKIIKNNQKKNSSQEDEELSIVKNAFVKIIAGKHEGFYGKVVSLDEEGRVIIELAVKKENVNLSQFMVQPVTKAEFEKRSKVLNADEFDQYKKGENLNKIKHSSPLHNKVRESNSDERRKESIKGVKTNSRHEKSDSDQNRKQKSYKSMHHSRRHSTDSSSDERRNKKYKEPSRKCSSSESDSSDSYKRYKERKKSEKRDIDKKRKGKKKKRDKDRTPNCNKHRK